MQNSKEQLQKPFYSTLPLYPLLNLKQPDQLYANADIPGWATKKLKIQQYCKTEYTQIITMSRVSQKILVVSTNFVHSVQLRFRGAQVGFNMFKQNNLSSR